jgi:hypothetical protein
MTRVLVLLAGVAIALTAVHAHHSLSGVYDSSRETKVEGTVAEFHFVNPHPFILVEVQQEGGRTEQWRLEMDNRSELSSIGVTSATFKRGDRIVVTGSPGRSQAQSLYVRRLDRPGDGFWYEQVGSTPRIRGSR